MNFCGGKFHSGGVIGGLVIIHSGSSIAAGLCLLFVEAAMVERERI